MVRISASDSRTSMKIAGRLLPEATKQQVSNCT
jgi:hypothetical protein